MRARAALAVVGLLGGSLVLVGAVSVPPAHAEGERHVDFDHDGYDDLVVPADEGIGSIEEAGAVTIMYGSASGVTGERAETITEDTPGVPDRAEPRDDFGFTHAEGDFNGDGYTDLAVSSSETIDATRQAGAVFVLWGSSHGITTTNSVEYTGDSVNVSSAQTPYAFFGSALAAGDIDGDGHVDLAIAAQGAPIGSVQDAGLITYLRGGPSGLTPTGQVLHQGMSGITGTPEKGDEFGWTMAAGDVNGDGRADLLIGSPSESTSNAQYAGEADIVYGQPTGLLPVHSLTYGGPALYHERFGVSVAIDSSVSPPNLYVYAPRSSYSGHIFRIVPHNSVYELARTGGTHQYDQCGLSLAEGNFGGVNGNAVAYGCPGYANFSGGVVRVRISAYATHEYSQDSAGFPGSSERQDDFGWNMQTRDLNGDGWDDLVIGVPFEDVGSIVDAGDFYVIYGSSSGLNTNNVHVFTQETPGVPGASETGDLFGYV